MSKEEAAETFGTLAIKLGFTTLERINECTLIQEKMKEMGLVPKRLGEVLVEKGYITSRQAWQIIQLQGTKESHTRIVGYKILSKIGQGAVGKIYKALQLSMDRIVAIKILSSRHAENTRFRERFLREARAVAKLNHPNIIQGIDVGESNGLSYFAMEYVDGPTVGELLKRGGAMDEKRAVNVVTQIARALHHAFQNGLIHRDIKPDNILLTRDGVAKLCDLGLVKHIAQKENSSETQRGLSMGTPHYISPEQARGEAPIDTRSDMYSLGATFYHMVVGEVPFPGTNAANVIAKHLTEPLIPPKQRNPLVSGPIDFMITKAMQKNPEARYQTFSELLKDLEGVMAGGLPEGYVSKAMRRSVLPKLRGLRPRILSRTRRLHRP